MKKFRIFLWALCLITLAFALYARSSLSGITQERDELAVEMETQSQRWFAQEKNLSDFTADLKAGLVKSVGVGYEYALVNADKRYYVRIDSNRTLFLDLLKEKTDPAPVIVGLGQIAPPVGALSSIFGSLSASHFSVLLMALLVGLILTQSGAFSSVGKKIGEDNRPTTRFTDVVGATEAKEALADVVAYLKNPKQLDVIGAKAPRGIILAGPPGTGKTLMAKALAGEAGTNFIAISGSDFSDKYIGVGVSRVKKLFKEAKKQAPCVVFIDEADGLGRRGDGDSAAETENNRIINAMLVALDGFETNNGVIVVAATNYLDRLDKGMIRDGRFDRTCVLSLPTLKERETLFGVYLSRVQTAGPLNLAQIARMSWGFSPASIANVVNRAALIALKMGSDKVSEEHLALALEQHQMGAPSEAGKASLTQDERVRIAVHEAGHAVVSRLMDVGTVEKVSIEPRGMALGVTLVSKEDQKLYSKKELHAQMMMLLAGRAAESLVLGNNTTGASNDLERVTSIAHSMVTRYGFSDTIGPVSYAGLPGSAAKEGVNAEVMREVREVIRRAEQDCDHVLVQYRPALDALTKALLEHETVAGAILDECLALCDEQPEPVAA